MPTLPTTQIFLACIALITITACAPSPSASEHAQETAPTVMATSTPTPATNMDALTQPPAEPTQSPAEPTQLPQAEPTQSPQKTQAQQQGAIHTINNGGNIRSAPQVTPQTVIGQVCPGDQVTILETEGPWARINVVTTAVDCIAERVAATTEGWVSTSLITAQQSHAPGYPAIPAGLTAAIVTHVVDGDTLDVTINGVEHRIRMIGIDTPETKHPSKPVECFGHEASARATELLNGHVVLLETDASQADRDTYGRLLRFVWLLDGRLINYDMVSEGYAFEYTYNIPYAYQGLFRQAQKVAQEQQYGLWAETTCGGEREIEPTATSTPRPVPTATPIPPTPRPASCDPAYPDVCIPSPPPDLDCADIPYCRFRVLPPDPHNFDGGGDGIGCERCP